MNTQPKLSICIPTYKRGSYIGETLESILSQQDLDQVEIVVADNASPDDTQTVIEAYQRRFPRLTYFRWPENMGADRNFLKVVELATAPYCWFLGSDDKIEEGGIAAVLAAIEAYPNLAGISVNRNGYDAELIHTFSERPVLGGRYHADHLFTEAESGFGILGEYLGYLSGQVVQREAWNRVLARFPVEPYFNAYVHIYVIGRMLQENPRWLYLHKKVIGWRSGNDSFMVNGRLKRLLIDVNGYQKIAQDVFGKNSTAYKEVMSSVGSIHVQYAIRDARANNAPIRFILMAAKYCFPMYWAYPSFWIKSVPFFIMPNIIYISLRYVSRKIKTVFID